MYRTTPCSRCIRMVNARLTDLDALADRSRKSGPRSRRSRLAIGLNGRFSYCSKNLSRPTDFTCSTCPPCCWTTHSSRRRHWQMARSMRCYTTVCSTLWRSESDHLAALAAGLSWIVTHDPCALSKIMTHVTHWPIFLLYLRVWHKTNNDLRSSLRKIRFVRHSRSKT